MHVERLRLTDFRNYHELDLPLPSGLVVFTGRNAQGKSNLLEAVMLAATSRSFRTLNDREAVRWGAPGHFARIDTTVARRGDPLHVEVVLSDTGLPQEGTPARPSASDAALPPAPAAPFRKRIRINGVPRRAMDLLGQITVVVFAPTDLDLVIGSPAERRRFLDMTLCQVHPAYCRALSQYQKIVTQRAALLRRIRDGEESPHALSYWDDQLARLAVPLIRDRAAFLRAAGDAAAEVYAALAANEDVDEETATGEEEGESGESGESDNGLRLVYRPSYDGDVAGDEVKAVAAFRARLSEVRRREVAQGANVLGPHRDDIAFLAGEMDLSTYGSRGQQRSVALALKLAELGYIERETGDQPILLLDDVLSELDAQRRIDLLAAVRTLDQVLLTTTDAATLPPETLNYAHVYRVRGGRVMPVT
ncbi:MAG: DNA recombination and repair protein RecF [Ktedonobacterales bacterium]|jgi:DNA replication and repair protein RecF|nr:MAG: DNA recombination and repair protein RecF [Ktedonobacterales bacterium]